MARLRFSLFTRIMVWFFLNLIILAAIFLLMFGLNIRFDRNTWFGGMTNRMETVARIIESAVDHKPRAERDAILERYSKAYRVDFYLFDLKGEQLGGKPVTLPEPVYADITRYERFGPGSGPRPPAANRQPGDLPPPGPPSAVAITTGDPPSYWHILRILTFNVGEEHPVRTRLLMRSDSYFGHGLFFDPRPWIFGAAIIVMVSVLFWLPLVRSMTRSVRQMTGAAEKIAEEDFTIRVNDRRTDELGRLGTSINHLATRLSGFVGGQKRFLGDISHELNSPLARMQFALSILEERARPEDKQHIEDVREEVELMSKLVGELLSYSKTGIKGTAVRLEPVELRALVDDVVTRERVDLARVDVQIDDDVVVLGQPELLRRAVANVLRNCSTYTDGKGEVVVEAKRNAKTVVLTISDDGPGVPDGMLEKIFDPLFRVQHDRSRDTGGTGLGLAIVRTCVEACEGRVFARNGKTGGLEVVIELKG